MAKTPSVREPRLTTLTTYSGALASAKPSPRVEENARRLTYWNILRELRKSDPGGTIKL